VATSTPLADSAWLAATVEVPVIDMGRIPAGTPPSRALTSFRIRPAICWSRSDSSRLRSSLASSPMGCAQISGNIGKAAKAAGATGDLFVTTRIMLPDGNDSELEALMQKWRDGHPYHPRGDLG